MRWRTRDDLVLAVGAQRADDEREVDLRRRRRVRPRAHRGAPRASATNSPGSSASARTSGRRRSLRAPPTACSRVATPASASEFGERLAPVRERGLDDAPHRSASAGAGDPRERDERRVDVAAAGGTPCGETGWKPASARVELDEHRHGAVRLRRAAPRRSGRRPRAAPSRTSARAMGTRDRASRRRAASRRCTGRLATSFVGGGLERRRDRGASASPNTRSTFVARRRARRASGRSSAAVELDRVHERARGRRGSAVSTPRPGPTSSTTSSGSSSASRPITPRMFSSTRKCWPSAFFGRDGSRRGANAAAAFACDRAPRAPRRSSPRASASTASVCTTFAGSFAPARGRGCGARYGLSVSTRIRSAGTRAAASRSVGGLRVRDVAGERDVVAALERRLEQSSGDEKQWRITVPAERGERARRSPSLRLAGVDHDRQPELVGERELRVEEPPLLDRASRSVRNAVEPGLADRDGLRMREQLAELVEPAGLRRRRLVRVDAERRVRRPSCALGDRERGAARVDPGADRDDPRDAGGARALDERRRGSVARVEVRVRCRSRGAVVGASMRGKSGGAGAMPVARGVQPVGDRVPADARPARAERREDPRRRLREVRRRARRRRRGGRRRGRRATRRARPRAPRPWRAATAPCASTWRLRPRTTSQIRSSAPVRSNASSRARDVVAERPSSSARPASRRAARARSVPSR